MPRMIRKQVYIREHHDRLLKRLSRTRGVSEAEIIRQAIERETTVAPWHPLPSDRSAWEEVVQLVEARKALNPLGTPYRWRRDDAYEEREDRPAHDGKG